MPETDLVLSEQKSGVLRITLNHPKANAFTEEIVFTIQRLFRQAKNDEKVRCVLLAGSGNIFSAGHDLEEVFRLRNESFRNHLLQSFNPLILQIRRLEKPVIAAINGPVAGAAFGVALACDLRIASEGAQFFVGFLGIGLSFDSGVSLFLPQLIGLARATEFAFTNRPISAQQALDWGLINRLVPQATFKRMTEEWAQEIANGPVRSFGLAKRAINNAQFPNLESVLDYEAYLQDIAKQGAEFKEGLQAFLEKRQPKFSE